MTDTEAKKGGKIALIDDDETCHMIFSVIIKRNYPEIQVETFVNAIAAFQKIINDNLHAAAIILDINMPRMTGWQFLDELKTINYEIPVYMLTSSDDPRDRKRVKDYANVKGYFTKPLRADQLQAIISENFTRG